MNLLLFLFIKLLSCLSQIVLWFHYSSQILHHLQLISHPSKPLHAITLGPPWKLHSSPFTLGSHQSSWSRRNPNFLQAWICFVQSGLFIQKDIIARTFSRAVLSSRLKRPTVSHRFRLTLVCYKGLSSHAWFKYPGVYWSPTPQPIDLYLHLFPNLL